MVELWGMSISNLAAAEHAEWFSCKFSSLGTGLPAGQRRHVLFGTLK